MSREISWGANYTPRQGWFHSWSNPDLGAVAQDCDALKNIGLDHIRIFPLWPLLQPNRTRIDTSAIDAVLSVVDAAGEAQLNVSVDLLQGHLSSFDFLPAWVQTWHRRNIFSDPDVVSGEHELARVLITELATRPHVLGTTLGNEIGQFAAVRHPERHAINSDEAYTWTQNLLNTVSEVHPAGRHQHCFDDDLWFVDAHPFTPRAAVELGVETTVHSWVFGGAAQRYGVNAAQLPHFVRYILEIADMWHRALNVPSERTVWLQEIGAPTPWVTPDRAAEFTIDSVRAALGYSGTSAITWWCSHDVSRELADFPELEYTLGLVDAQGNIKPTGEALREAMNQYRAGTLGEVATATDQPLVVSGLELDGSNRSLTSTASDVFGEWMESALNGVYRRLDRG